MISGGGGAALSFSTFLGGGRRGAGGGSTTMIVGGGGGGGVWRRTTRIGLAFVRITAHDLRIRKENNSKRNARRIKPQTYHQEENSLTKQESKCQERKEADSPAKASQSSHKPFLISNLLAIQVRR